MKTNTQLNQPALGNVALGFHWQIEVSEDNTKAALRNKQVALTMDQAFGVGAYKWLVIALETSWNHPFGDNFDPCHHATPAMIIPQN